MRTSNFFLGLTIFLLAACSSSIDEDLDIKKDVDDPVSEKTFSLLSVDVGYIENADALAGLIGDVNSDIAAIQRTGNGFPMKTAYALSKKGQRWQNHFFSESYLVPGKGTGFLSKSIINSTEKKELGDVLSLGIVTYQLEDGEDVWVATCRFDENDADKQLRQAEALANFADIVSKKLVIAAAVYADESSSVFDILDRKYRKIYNLAENNSLSSKTEYNFILAPLKQNWTTQLIQIEGEELTSVYKATWVKMILK
ncbi:hypothetical protein FQN58_11960 [Bacteroides xylanisolvens]|uniref:hypothetical protein n=1 Tax=Bacteroides xylanisolvens TaxID=371601 RepID=UPI001BA6EECE|nr:hypothetical protein [Bacteroides xylanisolvens]QUR43869.1 hypothetical protein FQN58_11960 [Bacteroides xylanisolvens]